MIVVYPNQITCAVLSGNVLRLGQYWSTTYRACTPLVRVWQMPRSQQHMLPNERRPTRTQSPRLATGDNGIVAIELARRRDRQSIILQLFNPNRHKQKLRKKSGSQHSGCLYKAYGLDHLPALGRRISLKRNS
jgi:hypothetical protein